MQAKIQTLLDFLQKDPDVKITIYAISALMALFMIIYFLVKGKKTALLYSYICFVFIIFLWAFHDILLEFFLYPEIYYGFNVYYLLHTSYLKLGFFVACFSGISWLIFCMLYTRHKLFAKKEYIALLFAPPVILFIIALTNGYHYLYFNFNLNKNGIFFWLTSFTSYTYFVAGIILLIRHSIRQSGYIRKQSILLILSISLPLALNFKQNFELYFSPTSPLLDTFDATPAGFSVALVIVVIATFKYRFLNIVPLALRKLVANLHQSIIVVDALNRVADFNKAFNTNFSKYRQLKKEDDIAVLVKTFKGFISDGSAKILDAIESKTYMHFNGEMGLLSPTNQGEKNKKKFYSVNIQPVFRNRKEIHGRIITFTDITEYKNLLEELNEKNTELCTVNSELSTMNEQLKEYASTVQELTITKERNRFARDVHDTLGHTMTMLITLLKVSRITCDKDSAKTKEKIGEAINVAKDGLKELRRSVAGLIPEKLEASNLISAVKKLALDFEASDMSIDFTVDGIDDYGDTGYSEVIFRACEEALTNSLRHGRAKHVTIILKFIDNRIKLFIADDGCGCHHIKKGFGLSGMEQRVKDLEGSIEYGSDGENGFNIYVEIPLKHHADMINTTRGEYKDD